MSVNYTCQLCGWSDNLNFDNPRLQHPDEAVCVLNAVERIDRAAECLTRKRTTFLRHLNASQASTRVFPQEVLSTIFEYACPPVDLCGRLFDTDLKIYPEDLAKNEEAPFSPMVLGAVSSQWRKTAWSTPRLWTSMARDINSWSARSSTNILGLYLQNTSNMPFALDLDFRDKRSMGVMSGPRGSLRNRLLQTTSYPAEHADPLPLEPLRHLIFIENPNKMIELRLNNPPLEWLPYFNNNFSALQTLLIGWSTGKSRRSEKDILAFENIPRLRKVAVHDGCWIGGWWLSLNPMLITSLEIRNIRYPDTLNILSTYPNLVAFKVQNVAGEPRGELLPITLPFTQYALKTLVWTFPRAAGTKIADYFRQFSRCARLPSIQNLSLCTLSAEAVVDPAFHTFLSQLPSTLTSLSLTLPFVHFSTAALSPVTWLPFIPQSVSHLHIEGCCPSLISSFFRLILDPSSGVTLPALTWVEFINMDGPWGVRCTQQCRLDLVPFLEFLRHKKAQGCLEFRAALDCRAYQPDNWDPDFREEIGRFVDEGFDLDFRIDGESNYVWSS